MVEANGGAVAVLASAKLIDAACGRRHEKCEAPYGNDQAFTYSSGQLTDIVIDVVAGTDHKITYTYFTSGDNTGQLQYIKVYKTTTTTDANLIAKAEYVYHDSTSDGDEQFGSEDDLMKVIVQRKATNDGDGTTSIEEEYHYHYYEDTYDASTNPGTDHQIRFVLLPENGERLNGALGDPLTQTNANFDDYANIIYEYDSNGRVRETQERLPGSSCGCGGAGGTPATTSYTWSVNGGSPDVDTWNIHGVADREDDSRVIFDYTRLYELLTWVVQDDKTSPTKELIWHVDYGTSGDTEARLTALYNPSACSAYDESSPYGVTLNSSSGVVHTAGYDTGSYAGYVKKIRITLTDKEGRPEDILTLDNAFDPNVTSNEPNGTGGGEYDDTEYQYDWRNRRQLIIPPLAPYTLIKHDNLYRVTAVGTYSATTNLDPGDDPATTENGNRLDLGKTYYDEWGRVYKTERYDDPGDATPGDALASNTYYDRRRLVWAVDAPNTGVSFTRYDGAGRRTEMHYGTDFDTPKYTGSAPNYLDDDENIVQVTEYTLDEVGRVEKVITKELNHDDTDGMDLTANDDYIRTYVYNWYDDAHRLTRIANYGTNNANVWKDGSDPSPGSVPARSDTVLVTTYTYDSEGRRSTVTDPRNIAALSVYDKLSRVTSKEEADGTGDERITNYEYDGLNSLTKITADLTTDQETAYVYADSQNARWVTQIQYPNPSTGSASSARADTIDFTYNVDGTLATRTDQIGTVITWVYDELRRKTEEEVTTVGGGVDSAVRAITTQYDSEGLVEYITSHTDTTPDTTDYTDATNQIKYTYDAADNLTKEEQEVNNKVVAASPEVQYTYGTGYDAADNFNRRNYTTYPDGRKIWFGYTHSGGGSTFQDTINDKFNRIGQIARDNSGSIGDILAEYDFNGMGRFVRREHDEDSGKYGNDTRHDLWHGTTGQYDGLDRFGRIVDLKHTDFSGTATDFIQRKYNYDRNSNRESIEHVLHKADSQSFSYDNLNRVSAAPRGILDSGKAVQLSDVEEGFDMDLLGNVNGTDGIALNQVNSAVKHTTNATNEISSIDFASAAGGAKVISDPFSTSLADIWTQDSGTWSISSGQVNVDTLSGGAAKLTAGADLDFTNLEVKITFPASSSTNKAGVRFADDGSSNFHAVVLDRNAGKIALYKVVSGSWGSPLASATATIADNTQYTIRVFRKQRHVTAVKVGESGANFTYDGSADISSGETGLYSDKTNVKFDDFTAYRSTTRDSLTRGFIGLADASISGGTLLVNGSTRGGEALASSFADDDYMVQVVADLNSGSTADIFVRYTDPNNAYRIRLESGSPNTIYLHSIQEGKHSSVASNTFTGSIVTVKIKVSSTTIRHGGPGRHKEWCSVPHELHARALEPGGQRPAVCDWFVPVEPGAPASSPAVDPAQSDDCRRPPLASDTPCRRR